ncbi:hypothetical protein [Caulobacter sp. Root1472]|uniref:hypothetical protein n=1 Tax=Caulobacter sp. Root1472 TaxID=1736470 RepID=UPI0007000BDD|nr:hypothetical protein [Caulobacter sp. Root1472]KQZ22087.1 hypothetical protein ASD47_08175 [Caulobacter sp. Root1472]
MTNDWLAQLRGSPSFATRLLPATASVVGGEAERADLDVFLSKLRQADRSLVVEGLDLVVGGYDLFLKEELPRLLDELRSTRVDALVEVGPALEGKPDWGRTVLGWTSGALAPGRMMSRTVVRSLEVPENIALRMLLQRLSWASVGILRRLGSRAHQTVRTISGLAARALADPLIQAIPDVGGVSERTIAAAENAAASGYRRAGRLLRRRLGLMAVDDLSRWRRGAFVADLGEYEFMPLEDEEIFELLALATVLDVLEADLALGAPTSFWMRIGTNARSGPVARFEDGQGGTVDVFFDRSPAFLLEAATPYAEVFARHEGLGRGVDRRPDICLVRTRSDHRRQVLFVEVKLPGSQEPSAYLRDSIYKAFGYLHDFGAMWTEDQSPKIVLFAPLDAGPKPIAWDVGADLVVVSARRRHDLVTAVTRGLGFGGF